MYVACELPHFLCNTGRGFGLDHSDGKTPPERYVLWVMARADTVFFIVLVEDICWQLFSMLRWPALMASTEKGVRA
jgi:hypothetical protein